MRNVKCEVSHISHFTFHIFFQKVYYLLLVRPINGKTITMNQTSHDHFNEQLRNRTLKMAAGIRNLLIKLKINPIDRTQVQQLIRSASSVAANYRSATRGRSDAEYFSKICIVVEEADETFFWLEYLIEINVISKNENLVLLDEVNQLVRLFSKIKSSMKEKIDKIQGKEV
jgi:four helix bundle protein